MLQLRRQPVGLGSSAVLELVRQVVSQAISLHPQRECSRIDITLFEDGSIRIEDNGPGIPFDEPISDPRFDESYRLLRGQLRKAPEADDVLSRWANLADLSPACALSTWMEIEVRRGGMQLYQRFESARSVTALTPLAPIDTTGTTVTFLPDPTVLSRVTPSWNRLCAWLRAQSALSPGLTLSLYDEKTDERVEFEHPDGIISYLMDRAGGRAFVEGSKDAFHLHRDGEMYFEIDVAICWRLVEEGEVHSIVNGNPEIVSGTHLFGLEEAIAEAMDVLVPGAGNDSALASAPGWKRGLFAVVAIWLRNTQITGREGTYLGTVEAREIVRASIVRGLIDYLQARPALVESLTLRGP